MAIDAACALQAWDGSPAAHVSQCRTVSHLLEILEESVLIVGILDSLCRRGQVERLQASSLSLSGSFSIRARLTSDRLTSGGREV